MNLPIDVALTESDLARDFLTALERRDIPEKFFYWFPLSVRAWLALCGEGEYRNFSRSHQVILRHAADVARMVPAGAVEVISLGAGQGDKDRLVLDALAAAGRRVRYRPVDASMGLLEIAVRDAITGGHATRGLKADLAEAAQLAELLTQTEGVDTTRLFMLLGNTLGGFDPARLARQLAAMMRAGDLALVDGELFAGQETLAGYDNPINRRFAFGPLAAAGLTSEDGTLTFEIERDGRRAGLYRVAKHFTASRDAALRAAGETLVLHTGDRLQMSPSHKYDEEAYFGILEEAALAPQAVFRSDDGLFLMAVVAARQP
jgi:uncharacterized SAM-dependent methyltransferase